MELSDVLAQVHDDVGRITTGVVTSAIPALARVDPHRFGLAFAGVDGELEGVGDWDLAFSLQSVSKVFSLALVLAHDGEALWSRVHRQPSVHRFNSLSELDGDCGIPRNPFVNAGALVVTDRLLGITGNAKAAVLDLLHTESGGGPYFDAVVAADEQAHNHRNSAIAHLIADHGNLHHPVEDVLAHYTWHCAIAATCGQLATAALFLARGGTRANGSRLLSAADTTRLNATLLTCGTYDAAGDFAYAVGLPAKSGIGGGILAVIPGRGVLCAWGPALDAHGNSVAGALALSSFTSITGWSIF
ncbi:glutaminase [Actinokineospora baliensis]|uniref:glutaminase A n=1 Tax=Actinokineospora baliensis TaxID=547056 RepID=UPI0019594A02|nr:glutaminase A [Actinokineospora baliensis]MBM7773936.1 glutaminase [Actinokineospora baliensis]